MLLLPAELTESEAMACLGQLLPSIRAVNGAVVEVDATALARFDSSALAVLLECRREAARQGKQLAVRGMPMRLQTLAMLYGVTDLVPAA